jgi:hypothetical protein
MKSNKKIKKHQLDNLLDDEFHFFGLVSSEPDYKLSLILNRKFQISLKSIPPIIFKDTKNSEFSFSRFSASGGIAMTFSLISNKSDKNNFLKKLKNVDFILRVYDPENESTVDSLNSILRETESVTAVFIIDPDSMKDKNIQYLML